MKPEKKGLFVRFDEKRQDDLIKKKSLYEYEKFSDALIVPSWVNSNLSIALISFNRDTIDYISLAKRGRRVVTAKNRVDFYALTNLKGISLDSINSKISKNHEKAFQKVIQSGIGFLNKLIWADLIAILKELRPECVKDIDHLLSLQKYAGYRLTGQIADIFLQERDALGVSLQIFSGNHHLRDQVLSEWAPDDKSVTNIDEKNATAILSNVEAGHSSFMSGIPKRYLQEESTIQHDLFNWPEASSVHIAGVSVFKQGQRRLEVHYANRNALERTLGVDLIYYNEEFQQFILVQYKIMREEVGSHIYRPDPQLFEELDRMDYVYSKLPKDHFMQSHYQYRLNDDGFMFKLVPATGLNPASGELSKGMYIPRLYMHFLLGPFGPRGSRGGLGINSNNSPRYMTNSQFSESVNSGWIGSHSIQSHMLAALLKEFYQSGRAILLAYESGKSLNDDRSFY